MTTSRRGAVLAFVFAVFGGAGYCFARSRGHEVQTMNNPDDRLRADLDRLAGRVYSEEGIPMFLACENMAPNTMGNQVRHQTSHESTAFAPTALNKDLASAFQRDADAWQRMKPEAPAGDVAKIVEMLADRDFVNGGAEKSL